jgi:hypothetical protein
MKKYNTIQAIMVLILLGSIFTSFASTEEKSDLGISLHLDFSAFETMYHTPDKVLANPDAFIANNSAWKLIMGWHRNNRIPENRDKFIRGLKKLSSMTLEARKNLPAYKIYLQIKSKAENFPRVAINHVKTFLPVNPQINGKSSTIYFTAFCVPYSMMTNGNMVIDLSRERWNDGGANSILNMSVHEFFHVGYGYNRYFRQEDGYADSLQNRIVDALQNEGHCYFSQLHNS